jgi:O-antigen ligase
MNQLIALGFWLVAIWLIRRDTAKRDGISLGLWIPTLWVGILASRPISAWLGSGGGENTLEGSPIDRLFYFGMIFAALLVLSRRSLNWSVVISKNWPVFLFYAFLLLSVFWANSPEASFKRWIKEFGNICIVLVILTEVNPQQAFRAVFVRCAYVLMPLSIIFIRYFPYLGRRYNIHSGQLEAVGVTMQKNSLGTMILVCSLVLIWDWIERSQPGSPRQKRLDRYLPVVFLLMGFYLLHLCDSKTSMASLVIGGGILACTKLPFLRERVGALGGYVLAGALGFFLIDWLFGIKEQVVAGMGRNMTFTGRTDVWRELLGLNTDPLFGTGFMSFWDDMYYRSKLPEWVAYSAHNGYLEIYIAGGLLGIVFLVIMLLATGVRINSTLAWGGNYAVLRFAVFVATVVANFSESNFACMTPLGFLFLLAAVDPPWGRSAVVTDENTGEDDVLDSSPVPVAPGDMAASVPLLVRV